METSELLKLIPYLEREGMWGDILFVRQKNRPAAKLTNRQRLWYLLQETICMAKRGQNPSASIGTSIELLRECNHRGELPSDVCDALSARLKQVAPQYLSSVFLPTVGQVRLAIYSFFTKAEQSAVKNRTN
jgi:hypothetical protein